MSLSFKLRCRGKYTFSDLEICFQRHLLHKHIYETYVDFYTPLRKSDTDLKILDEHEFFDFNDKRDNL